MRLRERVKWLLKLPKIIARYDAAMTTATNGRYWSMADSRSADASNTWMIRRTVRDRARYEYLNNSYAKGVVRTLAEDCISNGPHLQLMTDDPVWNSTTERAFDEWSKRIKLAEKLRTMRQAKCVDGETFAIMITNNSLDTPCKLDIQLLECDRITDNFVDLTIPGNVDGIKLDAAGNPVQYKILKYHPGSLGGGISEYETVSERYVIHWFRQDRPEQHRGVSELAPALELFAQLRRYTLAVLGAAESVADFVGVIQTDMPAGGEAFSPTDYREKINLEKRMLTTLPDGWKLSQIKAEQPTDTYESFKREILGEVGRALQLPVCIVTGDSSRHNYSSGRLDYQFYHRSIRIEQRHCESVCLEKIFNAWINEYRLQSAFPAETGISIPHLWIWDGFEHVDPNKEAQAQTTHLNNYTTTLATEYARQGKDWEVELRQIAKERALLKELGLEVKSDKDSSTLTEGVNDGEY